MSILSHSPFLKALGWTLLNSLWQFGAIWLLYIIIVHARKNLSPALRHGIALVLMTAGFVWFAAGLSYQYFIDSASGDTVPAFYNIPAYASYSFIYRTVQTFLEDYLSYFSVLYLLIVTGFFTRFVRFFFYSYHIQNHGLTRMRAESRLFVTQLVQQLDIRRKVQVWISELIDTPMVMGFLKPTILIPVACINQLSVKQLEAILLHELAHIKRNDYLINLYIATMEILFFFNPFARLLIKALKTEREKSCDDWVLQFRFDPYQYASALLALEHSRSATYSLAIAATGASKNLLLQRIQRIMGIKKAKPGSGFTLLAYFITIGMLGFIALVNPGDVVVKNLENPVTTINYITTTNPASYLRHVNSTIAQENNRMEKKIVNKRKKDNPPAVKEDEKINPGEAGFALPVSMAIADNTDTPEALLLKSVTTEKRNFSIKEKPSPDLPEVAITNEYPFVPNSSFSFYYVEDSALTKIKPDKNADQVVRHLVQAQKNIIKLEEDRITKLQNTGKLIPKLQIEIQLSLQELNSQKCYIEALSKVAGNIKISLNDENELLDHYKILQQQFKIIKNAVRHEQDNNKKSIDNDLKALQKQISKIKVIVHI